MSVTTLAKSILDKPGFQDRLLQVIIESVSQQFQQLRREQFLVVHDWEYLLTTGSVFALATLPECEDVALRIAQHSLNSKLSEAHAIAACVILDRLSNHATIDLAAQRKLVELNIEERLPLPVRLSWIKREISQSIITRQDRELALNRFQKEMWDAASTVDYLSVSAPTSSGKSFVFCHWLSENLNPNESKLVVYIVPTRALIQQVENDLRSHFAGNFPAAINISSLPMYDAFQNGIPNIFVFTQERFHVFQLSLKNNTKAGIIIVDEAQKVSDGARGILLQNVIDTALLNNPTAKVFFASPMVDNPEVLFDTLPKRDRVKHIKSTHVTVNQNLLWVSQVVRKPLLWDVELCLQEKLERIGQVTLRSRPSTEAKRLAYVAHALSDPQGGNLIYTNGAADAEKTALLLYDLVGPEGQSNDVEILDLIDLVKRVIHPNYVLLQALSRSIGFHYGNIPLLVRTEIERLFKASKIKFLVCTSTLVEGVNLPCKSIFVRGPYKGKGKPMNSTDFWNLAGRAGRLGKEFQGNIICIDPKNDRVWKVPPPRSKPTLPVKRASDLVFEEAEKFIAFVEAKTPPEISIQNPEYDQLLSYLLTELIRTKNLTVSPICKNLAAPIKSRLASAITKVEDDFLLPLALIAHNPGISPYSMMRLYSYFDSRQKPVEEFIPAFPESDDAVASYVAVLGRIDTHLFPLFGRRTYALALLVVNWMRGYPLARIIDERIRYNKKKEVQFKLPTLIREVMDDVEQIARFTSPKFISCYIDVLKVYLEGIGRLDLRAQMPDVNVWLEFGASQQTQLSLMGLGLSRSSAIALSEIISSDSLDQMAVMAKLQELDLQILDLPQALLAELQLVLSQRQANSG